MEDCLFCKIVKGDIPSTKIYEDENILAFKDINPEAPVHIIIIPKEHIPSINQLSEENSEVVSHIFLVVKKIALEQGIAENGYRVISNCGEYGGQTVPHLHFHLLGGKTLATNMG